MLAAPGVTVDVTLRLKCQFTCASIARRAIPDGIGMG